VHGSPSGEGIPTVLHDTAASPVQRFELVTNDVDRAHQALRDTYCDHQVQLRGDAEHFAYRQLTAVAGPLAADQIEHTMKVAVTADPLPCLTSLLVVHGDLAIRAGREETELGPGDVVLPRLGVPLSVGWDDLRVQVIRMPLAEVARIAAERWGTDAAAFRFESMTPVSAEMSRYWRDTITYLHQAFAEPHPPMASPLLRAALAEFAAAAQLAVFPHTATSVSRMRGPGQVAPSALRRAVAFIDAHATEPVTLTQMAEAAGVTGRALQLAFLRHYDTTPTGYLRRVRLERAHRELRDADPSGGITVAAIARRWGWANPSHFTAAYREAFGQYPRHTLRT
jgi:AraC-like DNA-binding protein